MARPTLGRRQRSLQALNVVKKITSWRKGSLRRGVTKISRRFSNNHYDTDYCEDEIRVNRWRRTQSENGFFARYAVSVQAVASDAKSVEEEPQLSDTDESSSDDETVRASWRRRGGRLLQLAGFNPAIARATSLTDSLSSEESAEDSVEPTRRRTRHLSVTPLEKEDSGPSLEDMDDYSSDGSEGTMIRERRKQEPEKFSLIDELNDVFCDCTYFFRKIGESATDIVQPSKGR